MKHFWVTCDDCGDSWVSGFISEHGTLIATDSLGTRCSDCGGTVEIGEEHSSEDDCADDDRDEVSFDF